MEELRLGKITNKELAEWFGAKGSDNISRHKKRYLEILKDYCDFDDIRGGIVVKKIYKSFYVKNSNYQIVKEEFKDTWDKSGLDTCSRVGSVIWAHHQEEIKVKESTTIKHTLQVRNELYGKPFEREKGCAQDRCIYILCTKNKETGHLEFLNEEEQAIKDELMVKWFGTAEEKTLMIQSMVDDEVLEKKDAWEAYEKLMSLPRVYPAFLGEFKSRTGKQLIRGTLLIENDTITIGEEDSFIWD